MNNTEVINSLKARGFHLTVSHYRISQEDFQIAKAYHELTGCKSWTKIHDKVNPEFHLRSEFKEGYDISPRGGRTEVIARDADGHEYVGISECSLADNYCRKDGITRALGRLVSILVNK